MATDLTIGIAIGLLAMWIILVGIFVIPPTYSLITAKGEVAKKI